MKNEDPKWSVTETYPDGAPRTSQIRLTDACTLSLYRLDHKKVYEAVLELKVLGISHKASFVRAIPAKRYDPDIRNWAESSAWDYLLALKLQTEEAQHGILSIDHEKTKEEKNV